MNHGRFITLQLLSFNFECCFKLQDPKFKLLAKLLQTLSKYKLQLSIMVGQLTFALLIYFLNFPCSLKVRISLSFIYNREHLPLDFKFKCSLQASKQ